MAVGCGLNTPVLQRGGNGRMGVLLNYSCGAAPCDPIDPSKPTIVITHGWNPLPKRIHTTFAQSGAQALKCRCGDSYNLLSWDWNGVRVHATNGEPFRVGRQQGRMMAAALASRGVDPGRTQIIAHSLGTLVAAQAAQCLAHSRGQVLQLTLLDPPTQLHEEIFCKLRAASHARIVENYWAPGPSGYGSEADYCGVRNYRVRGIRPVAAVTGIVDLSMSNHVYVMRWYYDTMRVASMERGFQYSALRCACGAGGPCCERAPLAETDQEFDELAESTDEPLRLQFPAAIAARRSNDKPAVQVAITSDGSRNR
ncbi:MAG: hypothetical protein KDA44_04915 [Planctomycetales bacterium]|nr:hypothetical protein [Planctomycetales bacterium]